MTILGTFPGIFFQWYLVKYFGRPSITVGILAGIVIVASIFDFSIQLPGIIKGMNDI